MSYSPKIVINEILEDYSPGMKVKLPDKKGSDSIKVE
jgi:hypothetical protein